MLFHSGWMLQIFEPSAATQFQHLPLWMAPIVNATLSLDVFLVLSGFLISMILMKEYKKIGTIAVRRFYYRRFMRVMPAYLLALIVGGFFFSINVANVWANLLYVNNLLTYNEQFLPWTWSLAVEEQFYFLLPLLLLVVFYYFTPRRLAKLCLMLAIASVVIRYFALSSLHLKDFSCMNLQCEDLYQLFDTVYDKLWTRFGSLIPGIVVAYCYVYRFQQCQEFFQQRKRVTNAMMAIVISGIIIMLFIPEHELPEPYAHYYYVVFRLLFSSLIGFFILMGICCDFGLPKFISRRLSSPKLYFVSQLSFLLFLFHPFIFGYLYAMLYLAHNSMGYYEKTMLVYIIGVAITLLLSVVVHLTVEKPLMNLRT